jgi:hypothetical protein
MICWTRSSGSFRHRVSLFLITSWNIWHHFLRRRFYYKLVSLQVKMTRRQRAMYMGVQYDKVRSPSLPLSLFLFSLPPFPPSPFASLPCPFAALRTPPIAPRRPPSVCVSVRRQWRRRTQVYAACAQYSEDIFSAFRISQSLCEEVT